MDHENREMNSSIIDTFASMPILKEMTKRRASEAKRTTFSLPAKAWEDFEWLGKEYDMSSQEIINHACAPLSRAKGDAELLSALHKSANIAGQGESIRKTQAISQGDLNRLAEFSDKLKVSRDRLLEALLIHLRLAAEQSLHITRNKHKEALDLFREFEAHGKKIEGQLHNLLDKDDPILGRMGVVMVVVENFSMAMESEIDEGTPISPDDLSQQGEQVHWIVSD